MLLLKTERNFQKILACVFTPLVILPASKPGESRDESKARANDLAVTARTEGLGVTVVESRAGELLVFASDNESQAVGFARKILKESKAAEPWFLLLRDMTGPLVLEAIDGVREDCTLSETGFGVAGRSFEIVCSYVPAQNNTAWGYSQGHDVGEHL
ncbi:MAG: hypothetical protein ABSH24_10155 [Bryobacteraceae bacterium]|jgi:hypothetical protein